MNDFAASMVLLCLYTTGIVSYIHGLVYAATHASWVWFVINLLLPPVGVVYGLLSWFF